VLDVLKCSRFLQGFSVAALWAATAPEAESMAHELDIPFFTDSADEVLLRREVDFVVVLAPPTKRSQIAVKALGIGKHVAVQCPGGLDQEGSLRMVQAALYYPRLLAVVNCPLRFLPAFVKMRRSVQSGLVGPSVKLVDVRISTRSLIGKRYSWLCDPHMGGGALNVLGSPIIDVASYLTGQRAARVHAVLRTLVRETDTIKGIR